MHSRAEVRDFLTTRRARITPERAGLPPQGGRRRVAGLRREEVALLAGVSVDHYTRLERGNLTGVSDAVLEALARALQLDGADRAHLFDLARAANTRTVRARPRPVPHLRLGVQRLLDAMTMAPAYVRNARLDVLGANALGRAVFAPLHATAVPVPNIARFLFLDPAAPVFHVDWEASAADAVALLRAEVGRDPEDRALTDLIGDLWARSDLFRTRWAAHDVRPHRSGRDRLRHPVVGELTLAYESMELVTDPGLRLNAYTAEAGSPAHDALVLLGSWAATPPDPAPTDASAPRPAE